MRFLPSQQGAIAMMHSLKRVMSKPAFVSLALAIAILLIVMAIWLPNIGFLRHTVTSHSFSFADKTEILVNSLGAIRTNFTPLSRYVTFVVATLTGVNVAMFVYYLRRRVRQERMNGVGFLGTIVGLLGVGCASCGSVVIASVIGVSASAGFLGIFPLKGAEFGILGIIFLMASIYLLGQKIQDPLVCKIN